MIAPERKARSLPRAIGTVHRIISAKDTGGTLRNQIIGNFLTAKKGGHCTGWQINWQFRRRRNHLNISVMTWAYFARGV